MTDSPPSADGFAHLLQDAADGKREALEALLPLVYDELRRLADGYLRRERQGQTIQATALVHEAYLRLLREPNTRWQNRAHFCAIAANSMRQILVERSRARRAAKRGGDWQRITLTDLTAGADRPIDVEALDEALERLAKMSPAQARLVEVRFFGGLTIDETADALGVSPATVKREWASARAWLRRELVTSEPARP